MPKNKKAHKSEEEKSAAWRTPVKLPTTISNEPIKSLYSQNNIVKEISESEFTAPESANSARTTDEGMQNETKETLKSNSSQNTNEPKVEISNTRQQVEKESTLEPKSENVAVEKVAAKRSEADFLRLLKTEKMDFYSLAEILRGSSMALYCVLYSESLLKNENRCQIRQTDLMMRAGINNPATLYKQERWLTALGLISKSVRLGNHYGASYEVEPLEILPLPQFIINQFEGYLSEYIH